MIAFGPVPSRRLGQSLGVNNVLPKTCSYSCVYCQLGRTHPMQVERHSHYAPDAVAEAVQAQLTPARAAGQRVDYITFVADGEPTLDVHLGEAIARLKPLGVPIAMISNASLVWREDVRRDLALADWVSLKADAFDEQTWRKIDRPHGSLHLEAIHEGMAAFAADYDGYLATETMLVSNLNDGDTHLERLAAFIATLSPAAAYLSIPTRPPAEPWVRAPDEVSLQHAYHIYSERLEKVEYLIGYEGDAFASTGNAEQDLLSITAVHPMRAEAVIALLARTGDRWDLVEDLVRRGALRAVAHGGHTYYVRKLALSWAD